jgi:HSP20 family protein
MTIQHYKPMRLLDQLHNEMHSLFNTPALEANFGIEEWAPAVDIKEQANSFVIHADLPGVKTDDIDVTAEHGVLTIKGERDSTKEEEKGDYRRIERFSGSFMRRFTLPDSADLEHIKAVTKDGVLELTVPKVEKAQAKKIQVKNAD